MIYNFTNKIRLKITAFCSRPRIYKKNSLFNKFLLTKTIFIHIPKTAGTSLVNAIYNINPEGHKSVMFFKEIFRNNFNNFFKFCFVRNPYNRLYSSYMFLKKGGVNIHDINAYNKYLSCYKDFEDFVLNGLSEELIGEIIHFTPQTYFICDNSGSIIVDFIGRFESLEKDVAKLSKILDMEINLPHLNINEKDYYIYTDEMKIKVNEVYKQDFDLLAY